MNPYKRDDMVTAFGKMWRVDWIDGSWLGISNKDGEHNQVTYRVVEPVNKSELLAQYVMSLD